MRFSRDIVTRVALILLAVTLFVAATGALSWRASEQDRAATAIDDIAALDLIGIQMDGMASVTSLRIEALSAGHAGAASLDLDPAVATVVELRERLAPIEALDATPATQAAVMGAALGGWERERPPTDDFVDAMSHLDRLGFEICCAGWNASGRGGSEGVGEIEYLAFGMGGLVYLFNDYLVQEALVADTTSVGSEYTSYLEVAVGIPRFASLTGSAVDPLFTFFPSGPSQQDAGFTERVDEALGTEAADTLRSSLEWVDNGGAASALPPPSFVEVMAAIRQVAGDQHDAMNAIIANETNQLEATIDQSAMNQRLLLAAAWAGYVAAAVLLVLQLLGLMRVQQQSEIHKHEAQAKLDMVSVVAHELRSPLTAVTGFAELLHTDWQTLPDEQITSFLDLIKDQSDEVMRLIDDLLTVRRIEAGSLDLDLKAVDIHDLTRSFETPAFNEPGRSVIFDLPNELSVKCDPDRMIQILRNYLDNARKYGGETVRVTTTRTDGICRISVLDDGDGVPAEDVDRIFARFDRGSVDQHGNSGYGLGLSIVRTLAHAMGGNAGYSPGTPTGAEFWVEVPLATASAD